MDELWAPKSERVGLIVRAITVSKISSICAPDPPTSQSHRQTDDMQCSRIGLRILRFLDLKKHDFTFFEMTYQKVVSKSLVLNRRRQSEFNFIYFLSDHCNSIPSSQSVIHSAYSYRRLSHTVLSCKAYSFLCPHF